MIIFSSCNRHLNSFERQMQRARNGRTRVSWQLKLLFYKLIGWMDNRYQEIKDEINSIV